MLMSNKSALIEDIRSIAEDLQNFRKNRGFIEDDELRNELAFVNWNYNAVSKKLLF